jgi:hypothetical protein
MADRGSTTRGMAIVPRGGHEVSKSLRIVGFDCGEDDHRAVLLDLAGEIEKTYAVANERRRIEEL